MSKAKKSCLKKRKLAKGAPKNVTFKLPPRVRKFRTDPEVLNERKMILEQIDIRLIQREEQMEEILEKERRDRRLKIIRKLMELHPDDYLDRLQPDFEDFVTEVKKGAGRKRKSETSAVELMASNILKKCRKVLQERQYQ